MVDLSNDFRCFNYRPVKSHAEFIILIRDILKNYNIIYYLKTIILESWVKITISQKVQARQHSKEIRFEASVLWALVSVNPQTEHHPQTLC